MKSKNLLLLCLPLYMLMHGCHKEDLQEEIQQPEPQVEEDKKVSLSFTGDLLFERDFMTQWRIINLEPILMKSNHT